MPKLELPVCGNGSIEVGTGSVVEGYLANEAVTPTKTQPGEEPVKPSAEGEHTNGAVGVCRRQTFYYVGTGQPNQTYRLVHSLGNQYVTAVIYEAATGKIVTQPKAQIINANEVEVTGVSPETGAKGVLYVIVLTG